MLGELCTEYSRKYYYDGPKKEFHTQNAAQRHAEWKENAMREHWGERFVKSEILRGKNWYQVKVIYK